MYLYVLLFGTFLILQNKIRCISKEIWDVREGVMRISHLTKKSAIRTTTVRNTRILTSYFCRLEEYFAG